MSYPWRRKKPRFALRWNVLTSVIALVLFIFYLGVYHLRARQGEILEPKVAVYAISEKRPWAHRTPCRGPRGLQLSQQGEDTIKPSKLDLSYPSPQIGSHKDLGLEEIWMTAYDRYGPYGFWDEHQSHGGPENVHSHVDWSKIDWAALQDECLMLNLGHFSNTTTIADALRQGFSNRTSEDSSLQSPARPPNLTGRTALVLRLWDEYEYTQEDYWHMRSLIVETAIASGGEYAVFLLVDAKDRDIYSSETAYNNVLAELVPSEFRSISILFNRALLDNWYSKTQPYNLKDQMLQPTQLFAHFISGFDHYWNLEADVRYSSHAGVYLKAVGDFARNEPRKQSFERSYFTFLPSIHGSYQKLKSSINAAMAGNPQGGIWGPQRIPEVSPIGPIPPTDPSSDDFSWGVGEDADVIVTSPCQTSSEIVQYVWRDWLRGFPADTPRIHCPPAVARGSWNLYNAIHWAQADEGLAVPSEDILPCFALWHGLKLSLPPQPNYFMNPQRMEDIDLWYNGGPEIPPDGFARGDGTYNATHMDVADSKSWWHFSPFPRKLMNQWLYGLKKGEELLYLLRQTDDGRIWMPTLALHPVKNE